MIWRVWCCGVGLPIGVLAAAAFRGAPTLVEVEGFAGLAAFLLVGLTSVLARLRDDEPERGRHLARASSVGLLALPALALHWLALAPAAWMLLCVVLVFLVGSLFLGARVRGSAGGFRGQVLMGAGVLGLGSLVLVTLSGSIAAVRKPIPLPGERFASFVYDVDSKVATRPLRECALRATNTADLHGRGAHPRLSENGALLWFDALTADGNRQIHRMEMNSRRVVCWTCGEPGNNRRPAPGASGVIFDTDRHANAWYPTNTELQLVTARGDSPRHASRRLTFSRGRDDHALLGPSGSVLAWSHSDAGSLALVSASLRSGHGGTLLASPSQLARGGAVWVAALAWSPDARHLLVVRGNPFAPAEVTDVDHAESSRRIIGLDLAPGATASFSADGSRMAVVGTNRGSALGLLPGGLGFLMAALLPALDEDAERFRRTDVRIGATGGELSSIELDGVSGWGEPTGVALLPDGESFILGQRREGPGGLEERLLRVDLDCR